MKKDDQYLVGYSRPPVQHQFKPGQSGNPSGRPKGTRGFISDLRDELAEVVSIAEGDGTVEVTKQRAIIKTLVVQAVAGDARAIATIIGSCARVFEEEEEEGDDQQAPEDSVIMQEILKRPPKRGKRAPAKTKPRPEELS